MGLKTTPAAAHGPRRHHLHQAASALAATAQGAAPESKKLTDWRLAEGSRRVAGVHRGLGVGFGSRRPRELRPCTECYAPAVGVRGGLGTAALELPSQPIKALEHALAFRRAARLDHPLPPTDRMEAQLLDHLGGWHRPREVLLVREDEQRCPSQFVLGEHFRQLARRVVGALLVATVHDEDDGAGLRVVMAPERPDLVPAANIPSGEADDAAALADFQRLDVEANRRDRGDDVACLQRIQHRRFPRGVQTEHQHLELPPAE
mmetsp:Transcript_10392/g.21288  ORF Transcript_10392/g.21288 Transcript_10392/m.21288 type:complete len:262 (-) Transcript_10392:2-787(-)